MNDGEELSCFKSSSQLMAGILVAISIPIFTSQLEKAREAVDLANIRAGYAEVMTAALTEDKPTATTNTKNTVIYNDENKTYSYTVDLKQKKNGWQTSVTDVSIGTIKLSGADIGQPVAGNTATITYTVSNADTAKDGTVTITFGA